MKTLKKKSLIIASVMALPSVLFWPGSADALTPIEELGKNIFFDAISTPGNNQACASCHDPAQGWILPNSAINRTTVVAPGAKPHALGNIKPPSNAYASFSPPFRPFPSAATPWQGGNFWDGRAEGYGALGNPNPAGDGNVSETVTLNDLPSSRLVAYQKYLGPTADQALNPFPNDVEQNIREKNVCQRVKTANYKTLYDQAFDEAIDCSPNPKDKPAYKTSYKRLAVALAAWQASSDVNSFSSKRDEALAADSDHKFPLDGFTAQENLGHALFFGKANCSICHKGVPEGQAADPTGEAPQQLYSDSRYRNIGIPFNREIPAVVKGEKTGLTVHVTSVGEGNFKTPTLRNVDKRTSASFIKAYMHNGYFKSLGRVVHFYNTRDLLTKCENLGIINATDDEARVNNCWPAPEFDNIFVNRSIVGNVGLTGTDEAALVAYLKTLTDLNTPIQP